ncbi:MAG: IS110 family transposase, partial [Gemmatimonadaceae bacterium]
MSSQQATQYARRERARQALAVVGVDAGKYHHAMVVRVRGRPDGRALMFPTTRPGFEQAVTAIRQALAQAFGDAVPAGEVLVGIEFAGVYGFTFAHYLHALGTVDGLQFGLVSVLAVHTKRWKEVAHRQPLKTDRKDAVGICDLAAQGHYVGFPFLASAYTELRYLLSARERLVTLRRGTITRLRATLDVVFPEFQALFFSPAKKTARALLAAYPSPAALLAAKPLHVRRILK